MVFCIKLKTDGVRELIRNVYKLDRAPDRVLLGEFDGRSKLELDELYAMEESVSSTATNILSKKQKSAKQILISMEPETNVHNNEIMMAEGIEMNKIINQTTTQETNEPNNLERQNTMDLVEVFETAMELEKINDTISTNLTSRCFYTPFAPTWLKLVKINSF